MLNGVHTETAPGARIVALMMQAVEVSDTQKGEKREFRQKEHAKLTLRTC